MRFIYPLSLWFASCFAIHLPFTKKQALVKRSDGLSCQGISNSTYSTDGATFTVLCDTTFSYQDSLDVYYTSTFTDCLTVCATYESSARCIGIQYEAGVQGPNDQNLCYLLWNTGNTTQTTGIDSAQLPPLKLEDSCAAENYTSSTGAVFTTICNNDFHYDDIHLSYAASVYDCAENCAKWNLDPCVTPCVGSTIDIGTLGPVGASAGYECWLKYAMPGPPDPRGNDTLVNVSTTAVHSIKMTGDSLSQLVDNRTTCTTPTLTPAAKGGIAGAAIGGALIVALSAAILFFFHMKKVGKMVSSLKNSSQAKRNVRPTDDVISPP